MSQANQPKKFSFKRNILTCYAGLVLILNFLDYLNFGGDAFRKIYYNFLEPFEFIFWSPTFLAASVLRSSPFFLGLQPYEINLFLQIVMGLLFCAWIDLVLRNTSRPWLTFILGFFLVSGPATVSYWMGQFNMSSIFSKDVISLKKGDLKTNAKLIELLEENDKESALQLLRYVQESDQELINQINQDLNQKSIFRVVDAREEKQKPN